MRKEDRFRQYSTIGTFLVVLFVLSPALAQGQDCDPAKQRIYRITDTPAQQAPDSLQIVLDLARYVRECERGVSVQLELWLLNNEALDGLQRYEEVAALVDRFFDAYFDEDDTSDFYRAKFYLWRLHFSALNGADAGMIRDYIEAQAYAGELDAINRAHLILNGAYAYYHATLYETALLLINQAQDLIQAPQTYDEQMVSARALMFGAEARLEIGQELPQVREQLGQVTDLYRTLGDSSNVVIATTLLGLTHAAEGDTSTALLRMQQATEIVGQSGSVHSRVFSHWRYGQLLRQSGALHEAEPVLLQASEVARAHQEYYLDVAYELALLYDQRRELPQATRYYQAVVDAPRPTRLAKALEAERKAHVAENRLLLIESERQRQRDRTIIGVLLLIVLVCGFVFLYRWRYPPTGIEHGKNGVYIPRIMPAGLTLDELKERFQKAADSALVGRRLAYIYATLYDPDLVCSYVTDDHLREQIETDRIKNNTALFNSIGYVEEALDNQVFKRSAANTISNHLRPEFDKRGWPWPAYPMDWKRFFIQYHHDSVFMGCL